MDCSLRRWKSADIPVLLGYMNNIHIWSKLTENIPLPYAEYHAKECLSVVNSSAVQLFAIVKDENSPIGGIKLTQLEAPYNIVYRLDFWIDPECWSDSEVAQLLKDASTYCFFHMPAMKLVVNTLASDVEYHQVLREVGFSQEAILTRAILKSGTIEDLHIYSMSE